jgi:hypothetical protein
MTSTKIITVQIRDVYGVRKYYPSCKQSKLFADIAGTTTLTKRVLKCVEALGYKVYQVIDVKE